MVNNVNDKQCRTSITMMLPMSLNNNVYNNVAMQQNPLRINPRFNVFILFYLVDTANK